MEMAAPHLARGNLRLLLEHEPVAVQTAGDRLDAVELQDNRSAKPDGSGLRTFWMHRNLVISWNWPRLNM